MFLLIDSSPLHIAFDPIQVEERLPSVAFNITAKWSMPFQEAVICLKETWFENATLKNFEVDLKKLLHHQIDFIELRNMSASSIIEIKSSESDFNFKFIGKDSAHLGEIVLKTKLDELELSKIITNIKNWDKWW